MGRREVLPEIRKTGGYQAVDPYNPAQLRDLLIGYTERVEELEHTVAEQAPKVDAYEHLTRAKGTRTITESAKMLGVRPNRCPEYLGANF